MSALTFRRAQMYPVLIFKSAFLLNLLESLPTVIGTGGGRPCAADIVARDRRVASVQVRSWTAFLLGAASILPWARRARCATKHSKLRGYKRLAGRASLIHFDHSAAS